MHFSDIEIFPKSQITAFALALVILLGKMPTSYEQSVTKCPINEKVIFFFFVLKQFVDFSEYTEKRNLDI